MTDDSILARPAMIDAVSILARAAQVALMDLAEEDHNAGHGIAQHAVLVLFVRALTIDLEEPASIANLLRVVAAELDGDQKEDCNA